MTQNNTHKSRIETLSPLFILFVGIHSVCLGLVIYFFTDFFYDKFFSAPVENIFFVRQSGVFLFLAGLFYLYPLVDLRSHYNLILLVIVSKATAVYFLVANAQFTLAPAMIYLAAFFDGLMGIALIVIYLNYRKNSADAGEGLLHKGKYAMTDK